MPDFILKVTMNNGNVFSGAAVAPNIERAKTGFEKALKESRREGDFIDIGEERVRHSEISSFRISEVK